MRNITKFAVMMTFAVFSMNCGGSAEKTETKNAATAPTAVSSPVNTNANLKKTDGDSGDVKNGNANKPLKQDLDDVKKSSSSSNTANKRSDRDKELENKNIRREDREKRERNDD